MKIELKIKKEFDVRFLKAIVPVRYWSDLVLNGKECPENGEGFPCKDGDVWKPLIDVDSGKIVDWTKGVTAEVHIKVVDEGSYFLLDDNFKGVTEIKEDYVPKMMCPKDNGYGDYVIMDILEDGTIKNWKVTFADFTEDEED